MNMDNKENSGNAMLPIMIDRRTFKDRIAKLREIQLTTLCATAAIIISVANII